MPNTETQAPVVAILMGSDSDLSSMASCARVLEEYGIGYDLQVLSAHRTPEAAVAYVTAAPAKGIRVFVCAAGGAAHLAGVVAAHTALPVIGVPLASSPLAGFDALLSTVQMPPGVPVATVGVGPMGAANAGHLAMRLLALADPTLSVRLEARRKQMTEEVLAKNVGIAERLQKILKG